MVAHHNPKDTLSHRVEFTIPGYPMGKQETGGGRTGPRFKKARTREYMAKVAVMAKLAMMGKPAWGKGLALGVTIDATLPIPESWSNAKKARARDGTHKATVKPDVDNISKIVLDSLSRIVYHDDAQVVHEVVDKRYGDIPHVKVTIWEV